MRAGGGVENKELCREGVQQGLGWRRVSHSPGPQGGRGNRKALAPGMVAKSSQA